MAFWIGLGWLLMLPLGSMAQDPYYRVIDASDGLPNNDVYCIFQDSKGFIWITTDDGLCRFDGHQFKSFSSTLQSAKAGANIFEDKYGRIWYENFDGRLYFVSADTLQALPQDQVAGFVRGHALGDRLYYPTTTHLLIYDLKTLQCIERRDLSAMVPVGINNMGQHQYWVDGVEMDLGIDSLGNMRELKALPGAEPHASGSLMDFEGRIYQIDYLHPEYGIVCHDGARPRTVCKLQLPTVLQHHALFEGKFWLCHTRGMEVFDIEKGRFLKNRIYFPDKSITAVLVDREGNHWFGAQNQGLLFVPDFASQHVMSEFGELTQVIPFEEGLMAGTQSGALVRYDPATSIASTVGQNESHHAIDYLTIVGEYVLESSPSSSMRRVTDLADQQTPFVVAVKDAVQVSPRYLAISVPAESGLLELPTTDTTVYDPWDSIAAISRNPLEPRFYQPMPGRGRAVAYRPRDQEAFFATANGLMYLTPHGLSEILFHGNRLYAAKLEVIRNTVYVLSTQGNFFMIDLQNVVTAVDDLPVAAPYSQLKLVGDKLYLLARRQLLQLDLADDKPVVTNVIVGLETSAINDFADYQGQLALATDDGLILLDPDQHATQLQPQLVVTDLRISGKRYAPDSLAVVDYQDRDIEIDYAILHFRTLGDYPLYYRINEGPWNKSNPELRQLLLAELSPGLYTIAFCLGHAGADVAAKVQIRIRKPFWMQWWFYVLCLLALAGLGMLWVRQRSVKVQRIHQQNLEKLALENNLRQSTLTAIRSQMNPHFFFNALNTIQAYIFSDDKKNATNYLSKFSKLTRMVLEMSERETVTLAEEIQAITLYLELEKSRFGDEFHFQIVLSPGISTMGIMIPSMIIQPFVENAVKHGLLHKTGSKELQVTFKAEGNRLVIEVDDNGIGRARSEELNRIRQEKHRSFSVAANKKRIDILNEGQNHIGVAFTDKMDADGLSLGTCVRITLPLLNPPLL